MKKYYTEMILSGRLKAGAKVKKAAISKAISMKRNVKGSKIAPTKKSPLKPIVKKGEKIGREMSAKKPDKPPRPPIGIVKEKKPGKKKGNIE